MFSYVKRREKTESDVKHTKKAQKSSGKDCRDVNRAYNTFSQKQWKTQSGLC
ncbi:hypothetical protein WDU94_012617 [Cyamophila willieti]